MKRYNCREVVILDFETTGLSPDYARVIEVGAVVFRENKIVDSFSELMNPGRYIPYEITALTGINSTMLKGKPAPEKVMPVLKKFIGDRVVLAHNASFDSKFLFAEMERANLNINNPILCTLLLARRLIPNVSNYQLGTLAKHLGVKINHAHRALDDVMATAKIWEHLYNIVIDSTGIQDPDDHIFSTICKRPKGMVGKYCEKMRVASI